MSFEIKAINRSLHVCMQGSIDLSCTNILKSEFEQLMSSDVQEVRVDAAKLDYIDSSGVASLLFMRKLCTRFEATLIFESISASAERVIQLANLSSVLGLPKAVAVNTFAESSRSSSKSISEPKFSDADALAIFQNDSPMPSPATVHKSADVSTFEIKPPSFS